MDSGTSFKVEPPKGEHLQGRISVRRSALQLEILISSWVSQLYTTVPTREQVVAFLLWAREEIEVLNVSVSIKLSGWAEVTQM